MLAFCQILYFNGGRKEIISLQNNLIENHMSNSFISTKFREMKRNFGNLPKYSKLNESVLKYE